MRMPGGNSRVLVMPRENCALSESHSSDLKGERSQLRTGRGTALRMNDLIVSLEGTRVFSAPDLRSVSARVDRIRQARSYQFSQRAAVGRNAKPKKSNQLVNPSATAGAAVTS